MRPSVQTPEATDQIRRIFRFCAGAFLGSIVFSLAGTLLLRVAPGVMVFFGPYYESLVKAPTWTYMSLLPVIPLLMYGPVQGWASTLLFLCWGAFAGLISELVGTQTGYPFGAYGYTDWLGPKILGHVPYFIPLSWFAMSIVSLDLAGRIASTRVGRVVVGALFMVLWDVSLDPAMSSAFPFWSYRADGFFYGMPAANWAGWLLVSLVITWGYEVLGGGLRANSPHAPWFYLANCFFPLGLSLLYGLYEAVLVGVVATAIPMLALQARGALRIVPGGTPPFRGSARV